MRILVKVILWLFLWPFLLPWWLWKRGWLGKIIASMWVVFLLLIGFALQAGEESSRNEITQVTPSSATSKVVALSTDAPTFTPLPTETPMPSRIVTSTQQLTTVISPTLLLSETPTSIVIATNTVIPPTATPSYTRLPTDTPTIPPTPLPTDTSSHTPTATNTPPPTQTATFTITPSPTSTPLQTATSTNIAIQTPTIVEESMVISGGLGLSKEEWESQHTQTGSDILGPVYDDQYIVGFRGNRIWYIERQWSSENAVSPQEVETVSSTLLPGDNQLVTVYNPSGRPETTVRLHMSEALKISFAEDDFVGGELGNFTVQYNTFDGQVTRMIIALGNNP